MYTRGGRNSQTDVCHSSGSQRPLLENYRRRSSSSAECAGYPGGKRDDFISAWQMYQQKIGSCSAPTVGWVAMVHQLTQAESGGLDEVLPVARVDRARARRRAARGVIMNQPASGATANTKAGKGMIRPQRSE